MKKYCWFIITGVLVSLMLAGCVSKPSDNGSANPTANNGSGNAPDGSSQNGGQRQNQRADILGEVREVKDGIITIKVANQPSFIGRPSRDPNATPRPRQDGNNGGGAPRGDWVGIDSMDLQFTGETEMVVTTADTTITKFGAGRGQGRSQEQSLPQFKVSDIKEGDTIWVWYENKEHKTVARINFSTPQAPAPEGAAKTQSGN